MRGQENHGPKGSSAAKNVERDTKKIDETEWCMGHSRMKGVLFLRKSLRRHAEPVAVADQASNKGKSKVSDELTLIQRQLLSKLNLVSKEERDEIRPGTYLVKPFTVRVWGTLKVLDDGDRAPTCSIPFLRIIALALKKMGIQRNVFMNVVREAMIEVLTGQADIDQALEDESQLAEMESLFQKQVISKLPREPRKGAVSAVYEVKVSK